jgi:hypothetical protein
MLARLSPDGRLVAFWSPETRRDAVFVAELLPRGGFGRRVQVMANAPIMPRWSGDGRTLYVEDERRRLMAVAVTAGDELRAAAPVEAFDLEKLGITMWAPHPDGSLLVGLRRSGEGDRRVYRLVVNFAGDVRRKLAAKR